MTRKNCTHVKLHGKEIDDLVKSGQAVSAKFVIPYPPGFPIMVPGQVITEETIEFMRKLDVKEIHGYQAALGLELIKPEKLGASQKRPAQTERRTELTSTSDYRAQESLTELRKVTNTYD